MPLCGPHVIGSTSWAWGISQTSPGHQSPADTLTWPRRRLGSSPCHGGRRPRTPTRSLPRLKAAALRQARSSPLPASRAFRRRLTPHPLRSLSLSQLPGSREPGGGGGHSRLRSPWLQAKGIRFHLQVRGPPRQRRQRSRTLHPSLPNLKTPHQAHAPV